jgi:hypothetical protein
MKTDIKKVILEIVNRIYLAQDRTHWRALVYKVMNFRVP